MNTTSTDPTAPPPPAPPQPPRSSFSCDRHPTEQFTGFCPSCLCERLTTLDHSSSNTPSSSRRPSSASATAAAAIKSLFSSTSKSNNFPPPPPPQVPKPSRPTSFFPELRRTKSFSASKNEALGLSFEPQRKSCDVRVRSTLWSLFSLDDKPSSSSSSHQNNKQVESCVANKPVLEEPENEEEEFKDPEITLEDDDDDSNENGDEIRPVQDTHLEGLRKSVELKVSSGEIIEEEEEEGEEEEEEEEEEVSVPSLKPMKDHIDLDAHEKKSSGGGFWSLSKKWNNWRRKQKIKKHNNGENFTTLPVEKPISRQYRETQSEIADYGFGRRSCDTDPRFSLDAARMSLDDSRYSFDEPRASWDGYLIGKSFPRMAPPMVSVLEDAPVISRSDMQIPVEEAAGIINEDDPVFIPGGTVQTRDYYLDSSSRRRKSLDRSSSIRKTAAAVVAEIDELKLASNKLDKDYLRDSNSNSLRERDRDRDDLSETFELSSGFRDSIIDRKETKKSSKRWSWRLWGFIQRRNKDEEEYSSSSRVNGVERSLSESWQEFRRENGNRNMFRSNSSVSWRNSSSSNNNIFGGGVPVRKSNVEMNGKKMRGDQFVLEKNRSARYSPNHFDNGLLRFYLTPLRGSRRGMSSSKMKPNNSHSIARSVLRLY